MSHARDGDAGLAAPTVGGVGGSLLIGVIACAHTHTGDVPIRTTPYTPYTPGIAGEPGEAEMPACPSISSAQKIGSSFSSAAWPAIVARIADPAADAHRVLYLLEPWPECARIVHHIGGNGTTDQASRGRRRKTAHDGIAPGRTDSTETGSVKTRANAEPWGDGVLYPPLAPRCDSESSPRQSIDTTAMPGTADQHPHTQPAELRQQPANLTASPKGN